MKKSLVIILLVLIITAIGAYIVFAEDFTPHRMNNMFHSMRNWWSEASASGEITPEQSKEWEEHLDYMEEFHRKNGISNYCGRMWDR